MSRRLPHTLPDLARGREDALKWDDDMATARTSLDWARQFELSIDPDFARQKFSCRTTNTEACSMCGDLCAIKIVHDALGSVGKVIPRSSQC